MPLSPLRALIVEDEALLAMELEDLLTDAGHEVIGWATTASEGKRLADTVAVDIAFIDVHLADGSTGIEVAEYLRNNHATVVVFLTANVRRLPADFAGALGVISKPYSLAGIQAAVSFLNELISDPPPKSVMPTGFKPSPDFSSRLSSFG